MSLLRVLLLNLPSPPGRNIERDFAGGFGVVGSISRRRSFGHDASAPVLPPLLEAYAAASARMRGHDVHILDCQVRCWDLESISAYIKNGSFELIVSRPCFPCFDGDQQVLRKIKSSAPDAVSATWGPVSCIYREELLGDSVDVVIEGELETCLADLCDALSGKTGLAEVRGISFSDGGRIVRTAPSPPLDDLDSLPSPAYELLDMERYYDYGKIEMKRGGRGRRFFTVLSSRGCPYGCEYCPYILEFGTRWRALSAERTVDEVETLVRKYSVEAIWFRDPTWNFDVERSIAICNGLLEKDLRIVWRAEMRADLVTDELAAAMKRSGCVNAQVGLETGADLLFSQRGKRGSTLGKMIKGFRSLRSASIPITANVMVGLPGESWRTVRETAEILDRLQPHRINVAFLVPYPGTKLFEEARRKGWMKTQDRSCISGDSPVLGYDDFSSEEIALARRYLLDRSRPKEKFKRLLRSLRYMHFGQAFDEVKWISRYPTVSRKVKEAVSTGE